MTLSLIRRMIFWFHLVCIDDCTQPMRHNHTSSIATNLLQASIVFNYCQEGVKRIKPFMVWGEPLAGQLECSSLWPCPAQTSPRQGAAAEET